MEVSLLGARLVAVDLLPAAVESEHRRLDDCDLPETVRRQCMRHVAVRGRTENVEQMVAPGGRTFEQDRANGLGVGVRDQQVGHRCAVAAYVTCHPRAAPPSDEQRQRANEPTLAARDVNLKHRVLPVMAPPLEQPAVTQEWARALHRRDERVPLAGEAGERALVSHGLTEMAGGIGRELPRRRRAGAAGHHPSRIRLDRRLPHRDPDRRCGFR